MERQLQNVFRPLAQGRHDDADHVEPIVEVLAETSLGNEFFEVLVRGGDHPHVDLDRLRPADRLEPALLQHAQHLDLRIQRDVADLVQK